MRSLCVMAGLGVALWTVDASAHIELDEPAVRDLEMKDSPCGGSNQRATDPAKITTFEPGQTVTVRWHETVPHPGYFRIAFSMDGVTFPPDPPDPPPAVAFPVLAIIDKEPTETEYEAEIVLPDVECDTCTLQLIQYMQQHAPPPWYYQCADIVIARQGGGTGGTSGSGGSSGGSGTSGSGGSSGSGGASTSGGGSPPANGGGTSTSGGGSTSTSGGGTPGASGSGGTSGGSSGTSGAAGNRPAANTGDGSVNGCTLSATSTGSSATPAVALFAALAWWTRRGSSRRSPRSSPRAAGTK